MRKISLRKCSIGRIDTDLANAFLDENHTQGSVRLASSLSSIGMKYQGELVAVIQFSYPRTEDKKRLYSSELLRLAFKKDTRIYRGASALISFYIKDYNPSDFFTYQDTSGEATAVYEHAGMKLVSQAKKKQYLVAPGKTLDTGSRREILGMAYATRYGPDRILGTRLGEVYRDDGTRKSNKELFLEELGWHLEETSGDRVYEWVNPNMTHYTYKITATGSNKYYYGVHTLGIPKATVEQCLNDGYMGSGGVTSQNKLRNWKKKHALELQKEILKRYERKAQAYEAEKELIGDSWSNDPRCLNSAPGGRRNAPVQNYGSSIVYLVCPTHGSGPHRPGGSCISCTNATEVKFCDLHGMTTFQAGACAKCRSVRVRKKACIIHGVTDHRSSVCLKCAEEKPGELLCEPHGLPINKKDRYKRCLACISQHLFEPKCLIHNEYYRFDSCQSCSAEKRQQKEEAKIKAKEARAALREKRKISIGSRSPVFTQQECPTHGLVTFRANQCVSCQADARISERECPVHGLTKFQGNSCARCSALRGVSSGVCEKHGESSFTGGTCNRCRAENGVRKVQCPVHGEATSVGDKCRLCVNQKAVTMRECSIHGLTKHQGEKCSSCSSMATAHRLYHGKKPNKNCHFCANAFKALEITKAS